MQSSDDFLTVDEAARLAGYSHWTVRRWLGTRLTRYVRLGRVLVSRAELLELVAPKRANGLSLPTVRLESDATVKTAAARK